MRCATAATIGGGLLLALAACAARAENIGRKDGDPVVDTSGAFVRSLMFDPVPRELGALFYLRAVLAISDDRQALERFDAFLGERVLDRTLGIAPETGASIEDAVARYARDDQRIHAKRARVVAESLGVQPPEGAGEAAAGAIRIGVLNHASIAVEGFSARLAMRAAGQSAWAFADCGERIRIEPGNSASLDCARTTSGVAPMGGDALSPQVVPWRGVPTEVAFMPIAISFAEAGNPRAEFTVYRERADGPSVDLKESREARDLAIANLREAGCWARGNCQADFLLGSFDAQPFGQAAGFGLAAGFLLGIPAVLLSRRRVVRGATLASIVFILAGAAMSAFLMSLGNWAPMFIPVVGAGVAAALVGVWAAALLMRRFVLGARAPDEERLHA